MIIGAMNHPGRDVLMEVRAIAAMDLQFIDLTLEPPGAASWNVNPARLREELRATNLAVVGHTAYYLPIASPFEEIRLAAVAELRRCLHVFAAIGAKWMNIHPDPGPPMHDRAFAIGRNLESLRELLVESPQTGVGLMIENIPGAFNDVHQLGELLEPLPALGLHLDIGHCNLQVPRNTAEELIRAFGHRLAHVHMHDNRGGHADLHLPLGTGNVDVSFSVHLLKSAGYDATITLEVFSEERHYLRHSAEILRRIWDEA